MNFEEDLHRLLTRTSPPDGFAERVVARLDDKDTPRLRHWPAASTLRRLAAAVALTATLGGLTAHQIVEHRRSEGERARQELMTALHIASAKVRVAQHAVAHD